MAKQAKTPMSVVQLRHATVVLDDLVEVRRRIDQYCAFVGKAEAITATLDRPGGQPLVFLLPAATILGDLEAEEERLCGVLHGLNVEVPAFPPSQKPLQLAVPAQPQDAAGAVPSC